MGRAILCVLVLFVATQLVACGQSYKVTTASGAAYYAQERPEVDTERGQIMFTNPDGRKIILERSNVMVTEEADIPSDWKEAEKTAAKK